MVQIRPRKPRNGSITTSIRAVILVADVITAETGAGLTRFPTAKQLASWAGTTPGNNEYAGKKQSTQTRPGNPYCRERSANHDLGSPASAHLLRRPLPQDRQPSRAAARQRRRQHSILVAIWHMGTTGSSTRTSAETITPG